MSATAKAVRDERTALGELLQAVLPGAQLVEIAPLAPERPSEGQTSKATGYGVPLLLRATDANGRDHRFVFRTATANAFGHERRADRAHEMLLAHDTFSLIPDHVSPIDVGAVSRMDGSLISLRDSGEFYLLTSYAQGSLYADELRRTATTGELTEGARDRCRQLARWLAVLHRARVEPSTLYRRSVRDLVGSGEGIFGIIDGYPDGVDGAPVERLQSIEEKCLRWRWRLRDRDHRAARIHGDFHPFNILFDDDSKLTVLDASRGCLGDPADDVACLAINYPFFALGHARSWRSALRDLWYTFWDTYMQKSGDRGLTEVVAPYLAWRGLVLANPTWYPALSADSRDQLLRFVERSLSLHRFDPELAEEIHT